MFQLNTHGLQTLKNLIERCWHPNPEKRPSFLVVIKELSQLLDDMPRKVGHCLRQTGPYADSVVYEGHNIWLDVSVICAQFDGFLMKMQTMM
jgi:hypothetical protein